MAKTEIILGEAGGSRLYFHKHYDNTSSADITEDVGFSPKVIVTTFKLLSNNKEGYSIWDSTINSSKFIEVFDGSTYTTNHGQMSTGGYYGDTTVSGTQVTFYLPNMVSADVYVMGE